LKSGNRAQTNIMQATLRFYQQYSQRLNTAFTKITSTVQRAMQTMLNRIKSSAASQRTVMKKHSSDLVKPYNSLPSRLRSIGVQAMNGLNAGLNAGKARVLSTARSIANQVTRTMQSALRIQSPSRVMRDKVGKWIPEGIAKGIEDNLSSVYKALNKLSYATPEIALGTYKLTYTATAPSVMNTGSGMTSNVVISDGNTVSEQRFNALINAIRDLASRPVSVQIDGREFVFATVDQMAEAIEFR